MSPARGMEPLATSSSCAAVPIATGSVCTDRRRRINRRADGRPTRRLERWPRSDRADGRRCNGRLRDAATRRSANANETRNCSPDASDGRHVARNMSRATIGGLDASTVSAAASARAGTRSRSQSGHWHAARRARATEPRSASGGSAADAAVHDAPRADWPFGWSATRQRCGPPGMRRVARSSAGISGPRQAIRAATQRIRRTGAPADWLGRQERSSRAAADEFVAPPDRTAHAHRRGRLGGLFERER